MGVDTMKTSQFRVTNNARVNKLNHSITKTKRTSTKLDFEIYSFVQIVVNFYDLKPYVVEHMTFILKRLKSDYHMLCNNASLENMVIAAALYAMNCSGLPCYNNIDISGFVNYLYRPEQQRTEIIQIYELYHTVQELFYDSSEEILPYVPVLNPYAVSYIN
jgi:hypothetical protein